MLFRSEIVEGKHDLIELIGDGDHQFMVAAFSGIEHEFFRHIGVGTFPHGPTVPENLRFDPETVDGELNESAGADETSEASGAAASEPGSHDVEAAGHGHGAVISDGAGQFSRFACFTEGEIPDSVEIFGFPQVNCKGKSTFGKNEER